MSSLASPHLTVLKSPFVVEQGHQLHAIRGIQLWRAEVGSELASRASFRNWRAATCPRWAVLSFKSTLYRDLWRMRGGNSRCPQILPWMGEPITLREVLGVSRWVVETEGLLRIWLFCLVLVRNVQSVSPHLQNDAIMATQKYIQYSQSILYKYSQFNWFWINYYVGGP